MKLYEGDCLEIMKTLETGSIDMILCDLPYGTTACKWDSVIPFALLWDQYKRIAKQDSAIVLTASQPFTTALISSNYDWFKYCLVWEKASATGVLDCKFRPLKAHEDIVIFSASGCSNGSKPPMKYNPQMTPGKPYSINRKNKETQKSFSRSEVSRTDTHSDGNRYPRSVVYFKNETGLHPTQKPVALMEYLIRTYTKEGEIVLDNTMGSGTTGIACKNAGREFIGIERDPSYFSIAKKRIEDHIPVLC